jgi:hypothetical protein
VTNLAADLSIMQPKHCDKKAVAVSLDGHALKAAVVAAKNLVVP